MKIKNSNRFIITWIIIMVVGTAFMFAGITHESLWYDESYTAALMNHSFGDIVNITGQDSHPPLYYLLLRVFTFVFGCSVRSLRIFSIIGTVALAALGIGPVRRVFGNRFASIYSFLIFALPITFSMSHEARMYTWAAFFVTSSALFAYLALKEGNHKDWICFGVSALLATYTHYYALLAAFVIFALLFVMMLIRKKRIVPFIITAGIVIAGYLPWVFILAKQVKRVSSNFWIPPVSGYLIKNILMYPFSNKFSNPWSPLFVGIAFIISALLIVFGIVYRIKRKDDKGEMAMFALGSYALTILAGVIASFIIRPVLVERYIMPVFGLFVIGLAYGISRLGEKRFIVIACSVVLVLSLPQNFYSMFYRFNGPMKEAVEYVEPVIQPGDVFLHTDEHTLGTFCYYFSDYNNYYFQKEGSGGYSNYDAFMPNGITINSLDEIDSGGTVWLIQRNRSLDTTSMENWISSGRIKYAGEPESFEIYTSWYSFVIYPVVLE